MSSIGRSRESMLVASFLDASGPGARALLVHGEAGIGKTTLWREAVDAARDRGYRILAAVPSASEAHLPFAGLTDLLSELADEVHAALPPPQRAALDVALMRADADAAPAQPLALSLAVLEVLRAEARGGPIAVAVDDVQWLDAATSGALRFALRRLDQEPVVVLVSERSVTPDGVPGLLADLPDERMTRVRVEPLEPDAVDRLLEDVLGLQLPPTEVARVHRLAGGNPLHVLEIGRAIGSSGSPASVDRLQLPDSLAGLVRRRIAALPEDAVAVVTHAAAIAQPTVDQLRRVLGEDRAARGLAAAREADILLPVDEAIRFTHPLLGGEAYAGLDEEARRVIHRRLAEVVDEPEERARHRALAASEPDADVAADLDAAAERARSRGAPDAAADLAELAAGLTPPGERDWAHRIAEAARHRTVAGDLGRARTLLEDALGENALGPGEGRAEITFRLAIVRQLLDDFDAARELGAAALAMVDDGLALTIEIRLLLAGVAFITGVGWAEGSAHVREAMALAQRSGDPRLQAMVLGKDAQWRYMTGGGLDPDFADRAAELEPWTAEFRALDTPLWDLTTIRLAEGLTDDARAGLRELAERADREGDYSSLPFILAGLAMDAFLEGRRGEAETELRRAIRLARTTEQRVALVNVLVAEARIQARLGNRERALAAGEEAFALIEATKWRVAECLLRADLALLELSDADPAAAMARADATLDLPARDESPRRLWAAPALAQVLVALGRHDEAARVLDELDGHDAARSRALRADAQRARAQLLAATGDLDEAEVAIAAAEEEHRRVNNRWELARTLLVAGEVHRRGRHRARARAAFAEALSIFGLLGAASWVRLTREQMRRAGSGQRQGGLTPAQRRVAELAATGLTNRQVGDRLSMSVHTVEAHLSEAYRSLGIRSRRELASRLATEIRDTGGEIRDRPAS